MYYCADFETTTQKNYELEGEVRVWGYATIKIGEYNNFHYGNNINSFMEWCNDKYENKKVYFHNIAFDGMFILYWLHRNGYREVEDRKYFEDKTFTTLITDTGVFYSIEVCFKKKGKKINKVEFLDSMKLLNFSVDKIGKDFGFKVLKIEKEEEFYNRLRDKEHELTVEEIEYMRNDVEVVARALEILKDQKLSKNTVASCAMQFYKSFFRQGEFEYYYPQLDLETDEAIRHSYKGGWTYCDKRFKNKLVGEGLVYDVNSLYPSVMRYARLPIGEPIYFKGKYKKDEDYDLYVQRFSCQFRIKENHLPTIQKKGNYHKFNESEYLEASINKDGEEEIVTLTLTSVDLKLFFDHYEPFNIEYIDGYKFRSSANMFNDYIDYWIDIKIKSEENRNPSMRAIAKLMLNSLYGKFGLNPHTCKKHTEYDKDLDLLKLPTNDEEEIRKPVYIPMACFITAYAREKTIRSAQKVYDRFLYADTDSLHILGTEVPEELEVHSTKLGAWKNEMVFDKAKYLRQKCYMEHGKDPFKDEEMVWKITCAGMPKGVYKNVNIDNFEYGAIYDGKLQKKSVRGGVLLINSTYQIKENL